MAIPTTSDLSRRARAYLRIDTTNPPGNEAEPMRKPRSRASVPIPLEMALSRLPT